MEASDIRGSRQLSRPENLSRGQYFREVDHNKSGKNPANICGDEFAMQSQTTALSLLSTPAASTIQARTSLETNVTKCPRGCRDGAEDDFGEQLPWPLDATVPASRECRTVPAAAITPTDPPLLHVEVGKKSSPKISCAQDNAPARASQEIARLGPTPSVDSTDPAPLTKASQGHDGQGAEEISSPARRHRQVRLSTDLFNELNFRSVHSIEDHESRTSDMSSKYGTSEGIPFGQFSMPYLDGMSRTFDFHEMGLFLEIECPRATIVPCARPQNSKFHHQVVEVDKIEPGTSLNIDMGENFSKLQSIFLTKRSSTGIIPSSTCIPPI
ncbi:hypothetical protein LTR67_011080 [Exophiala xenobiotica]